MPVKRCKTGSAESVFEINPDNAVVQSPSAACVNARNACAVLFWGSRAACFRFFSATEYRPSLNAAIPVSRADSPPISVTATSANKKTRLMTSIIQHQIRTLEGVAQLAFVISEAQDGR